jgi:hypothetical protein
MQDVVRLSRCHTYNREPAFACEKINCGVKFSEHNLPSPQATRHKTLPPLLAHRGVPHTPPATLRGPFAWLPREGPNPSTSQRRVQWRRCVGSLGASQGVGGRPHITTNLALPNPQPRDSRVCCGGAGADAAVVQWESDETCGTIREGGSCAACVVQGVYVCRRGASASHRQPSGFAPCDGSAGWRGWR